jgi:hypothetical protein
MEAISAAINPIFTCPTARPIKIRGITISEPIKEGIYKISVSKLTGIIFARSAVSFANGSPIPERSFAS